MFQQQFTESFLLYNGYEKIFQFNHRKNSCANFTWKHIKLLDIVLCLPCFGISSKIIWRRQS